MAGLKLECLQQVSEAVGRQLTEEEGAEFKRALKSRYRRLRKEHPELAREQLFDMAAKEYSADLLAEAERIRLNAYRQVHLVAEMRAYTESLMNQGASPREAAHRYLDMIHKNYLGVSEQFKHDALDLINNAAPRLMGLMENDKAILGILRELSGEDTGNADFKAAAKAWADVAEQARQRFNNAGGNIRELEGWVLPQTHDRYRIMHAAKHTGRGVSGILHYSPAENKAAWVDFVFDKLDRSKYLDDDLKPMSDNEVQRMLEGIYDTIVTDGTGDIDASRIAGQRRGKSRANQHAEHRAIHFKDAQSRFDYNKAFGQNPSIIGTMLSHLDRMAKDITLIEMMGPSPNQTYGALRERTRVLTRQGEAKTGSRQQNDHSFLAKMWANLNGDANIVGNELMSGIMQDVRNLEVAGKLGSALITSISDLPTYFHTSYINRMPFAKSARMLALALDPKDASDRRFVAMAGIVGDSMNSAIGRFVEGNLGRGVTSKLADLTLRASFLTKWTEAIRRAQAMTTMSSLAESARQNWHNIDGWLRNRLENFGVDEKMWQVLQRAEPEEFKGARFLTINSIRNIPDSVLEEMNISRNELERIGGRYLGFVTDDAFMASLQPDLGTRAIANLGLAKGTLSGELTRSIMLFKSFPIGMISRHMQRSRDLYRYKQRTDGRVVAMASRTRYVASLIVATTLSGYVTNMLKDVINNKDIEDLSTKDAFARAFTTGGGAGIFGDFIVSALDDYKYGHPAFLNILGPVISSALDAYTIFDKYKDDKDVGSNVLRNVKGHLPFVNVWYSKQLLDHTIFSQMQEMINPGHHARIERKMLKNHGTGYWWRPNELLPRRLPRMATQPR